MLGRTRADVDLLHLFAGGEVADALFDALRQHGAARLGSRAAESLRIEAGIPRFGADMDEDTIPLEAGIEARAISMTKGCYIGQEVIVRILHRGQGRVAKRLVGLRIEGGSAPPPGTSLAADGRDAGRVTSSVESPRFGPIALGYVHRDLTPPGTRLEISGRPIDGAVVSPLPFGGS